jgi:hypothetical protein
MGTKVGKSIGTTPGDSSKEARSWTSKSSCSLPDEARAWERSCMGFEMAAMAPGGHGAVREKMEEMLRMLTSLSDPQRLLD